LKPSDHQKAGYIAKIHDATPTAPIQAVANHQTGVEEWDVSTFEAPDYLSRWKRRVPKRVVFNYLDSRMTANPDQCLRQMIDYFEHEETKLADRFKIGKFLKEMIVSGQIDRLPSDWLAPGQLMRVVLLAKKWGIPVGPRKG